VTVTDSSGERYKEALQESEARFREMVDGLPLIVWVHDAAGAQEMVNATFCEFFGVTREEMKGGRWQILMHPDDADAYLQEFLACVDDRRPFRAQVRVQRADGQWRWIESWGRPRLSASGEFRGFVGTSADITERKQVEAALKESEARLRTLADNIAQHAWMADGQGSIFWYNQRWFDYTGTTFAEVEGWGWDKVHHPDHLERVTEGYRRCLASGRAWEDIFPLRGRDGRYRWFLSRAVPIRDESGQVVRWLGTNTDITEQRQAEQQLRESDRRKDEYIAMLGHELRNPLAAIRNATELIKLSELPDPRLQRAAGVLERQSTHMARLIDGLLEVSRIARGTIDLQLQTVDLRTILDAVARDRMIDAAARALDLHVDVGHEPLWVRGDPVRLTQVFDNLIGNAIKFTNADGRIVVSAWRADDHALARVRDTGVGIQPEMLSAIFEPFRQEAQDVARAAGGLGLGLALAKALVELHAGTIAAHSEGRGAGAELEVRLPLVAAPAQERPIEQLEAAPTRRVLLIEDNADAAEMLRSLLELRGHEVRTVSSGPEALALLRQHAIDLVLCDIGLPDMSGYDIARSIRANQALRELPLVALTGYGQLADQRRAEQSGFDEHLTKPVDLAAIDDVLRRL
jgi:PAS domain S-box-containing protein